MPLAEMVTVLTHTGTASDRVYDAVQKNLLGDTPPSYAAWRLAGISARVGR